MIVVFNVAITFEGISVKNYESKQGRLGAGSNLSYSMPIEVYSTLRLV